MAEILSTLPPNEHYRFRFITIQIAYNPRDPADVTVDALRERVEGALAVVDAVWKVGLKQAGASLMYAVECSGSGFVHVHILYYGPFVAKRWLEAVAKAAYARVGHSWIEAVAVNKRDFRAVLEVTKYLCKAPSPLSEEWLDGRERDVTHPVIAARFEVACARKHTAGVRGVFRRRVQADDAADIQEQLEAELHESEQDASIACEHCGAVGRWVSKLVSTRSWVRECHRRGSKAFQNSRWRPSCARYGPFLCRTVPIPIVDAEAC